MVHPGSFRPCDCWDWIMATGYMEDEDVRSQQKPAAYLGYGDTHEIWAILGVTISHSWDMVKPAIVGEMGLWDPSSDVEPMIFRQSWPWSTSMICTFCTATWNRETSSCQRVAGCSAISAHLSTLETSNLSRAIPELQSHSTMEIKKGQDHSGPRSRMKLSCLRFQWSFLFAKEISRWVTSALPRPDFSETPKDRTLSWIPTAFFFTTGSGQVHLVFRKKHI